MTNSRLLALTLCFTGAMSAPHALCAEDSASAADWSHGVVLPEGERPVELFSGTDLSGWRGQEAYFSVDDGAIRAANKKGERVEASTYLFTDKQERNFRLLFEVKQTLGKGYSTMHSAIAFCGQQVTDSGGAFGHRGLILMFCHDWGIWEAGGRGRVYPPGQRGPINDAEYEKKGEWNQIEILVIDNRVKLVANGRLVVDHQCKQGVLKPGPIGLQLHNNKEPQEFHFRGLVLVEEPRDQLLTRAD